MGRYQEKLRKEKRFIERAYEQNARDLEKLTKEIEQKFNGMDIRSRRSFQTALKSLERLKEDALRHYDECETHYQMMAF